MSPLKTTLFHQPTIKFFCKFSCSSSQLKTVKPFSVHRFPTSNSVSSPGFAFNGAVSRKTGDWSPYTMIVSSTKASVIRDREGYESGSSDIRAPFMAEGLEATINRQSKWIVAALFGFILLCRHDAEAVWFAGGSIVNSFIAVTLKRILNQERPVTDLRSDPGMPSSHAQSIFFVFTFAIISFLKWWGLNEITLLTGGFALAFATYLSWLRVSQQFHTISQIAVGAILGSVVSILWDWSWNALVMDAFESLFWVEFWSYWDLLYMCFVIGFKMKNEFLFTL